jgi:hypothetical protein
MMETEKAGDSAWCSVNCPGIAQKAAAYRALVNLTHINLVWVSTFLIQSREEGSYNLVQNTGHKGPVLKPTCIGPSVGLNPKYSSILFFSILSNRISAK